MAKKKQDKEVLVKKFRKSVEDVFGWKVFIFLPQNFIWRFFILQTIVVAYAINTIEIFYGVKGIYSNAISILCGLFYFIDSLCATLHCVMVNTRKLRHGKRRPLFYLFLDYISLIPFNMVYEFLIYGENAQSNSKYFEINSCLRIYQTYTCFSDVKLWIHKVKIYFIVTFLEIGVYCALIVHFLSCMLFINFNDYYQKKCRKDLANCIIQNELTTLGLVAQSYTRPLLDYPLDEFKLLITIDFLVGYIFTFGYVLPLLVFVCMKYLRGLFEFTNQFKQLNLLINHTVEDKDLKKKIIKYYDYRRRYGKGDLYPEAINVFPLCFQKSLFCDLHWDAFRHSELLQLLSRSCKRTLSLYMRTEFVDAQTILLKKNDKKVNFMYLESGMIQIMAEENSKSPVIGFSSGSVFGESSFFYQTNSKVILQTAKFSVIHFLNFKYLFRVLLDYPKDMDKISKKMKLRLKLAAAAQNRKLKIRPQFVESDINYASAAKEGNADIKWLKQQFRIISELNKYQGILNKTSSQDINYQRLLQNLKTQLEHSSAYLSLLVINDEVVNKYEAVCLKMSFPWLVDPQSNFLKVWNGIIFFVALNASVLYPIYIGWYPYLPYWFYDVTVATTFIYIIDIIMQLTTAVKIKNIVIPKFWTVFLYKLTCPSFYADVFAALPLQVLIQSTSTDLQPYTLNLYVSNALIKSYKIISFLNEWNYNLKPNAVRRTVVKYVFIIIVTIYWFAAVLNLTSVECIFFECKMGNLDTFEDRDDYYEVNTFLFSVFVAFDIPYSLVKTKVMGTYLIFFLAFLYFRFVFFICQAESVSAYVLENSHGLKYKSLMGFVFNFMQNNKIVGRIKKRVLNTMQFHWNYDYGGYLTTNHRFLDGIDEKLKEEIDSHTILQTLAKCRLFKSENTTFHADLCRKASRLALPADSVLITFGTQAMSIYVIHKGYVQVNSFLPGDLVQNVGTPIFLKNGDAFPIITCLNQIPSPFSARTLTDCELLSLNLEETLLLMIDSGIFKDVVDALKATDISSVPQARLGLSKVTNPLDVDKKHYPATFGKLKYVGYLVKYLFLKRSINSLGHFYVQWELFRVFCIMLGLALWPFVFGCLANVNNSSLEYFLLFVDGITWIDFYIRLHVAYYTKKGMYVTSPLDTSLHYLSTSFILDFIAFAPHFHAIYLMKNNISVDLVIFLTHYGLRLLGLYRFFGFLNYLYMAKKLFYVTEILKYMVPVLLVLNFYVNLMVFNFLRNIKRPKFAYNRNTLDIAEGESIGTVYFQEMALTCIIIMKIHFSFKEFNLYTVVHILFFSVFGWIGQLFLFSFLTLNSTSVNLNFTTYQYYMKSFSKYLTKERADDTISNEAIGYFEYEWEKKKGEDLHKIFSRFPHILHEDLMFPLYKVTLSAVQCLSRANEAFYKILSRNVSEIYLTKESAVIFSNQVQEDIYFIHKGQCVVEQFSKTLYRGSMIGDIRKKGLMKNTIVADTHVALLKIPSKIFFQTMDSFHVIKRAFEFQVNDVEDFVESIYIKTKTEKGEILIPRKKEDFVESEFEILDNFQQDESDKEHLMQENTVKSTFQTILSPFSMNTRILKFIFLMDAYLTVLLIPILIGIRLLSIPAFIITYTMDVIWIFKIISTLKTPYYDPKTGNLITHSKAIFRRYLHQFDGLIIDVISVLPLELIPLVNLVVTKNYDNCHVVSLCLMPRILRFFYFLHRINKEKKKLSMNFMSRMLSIFGLKTTVLTVFSCICLQLYIKKWKFFGQCYWNYDYEEWDYLKWSFLCVTNNYVGGGMYICEPETVFQVIFTLFVGAWSIISKALLVNQVLTIFYVTLHTKSDQMHRLEQLEKFVTVRDLSPSLFQTMRRYFCDLMDTCKEEAMPSFLKASPTFIKVNIMKDLYMNHLKACYIFQGLDDFFLKQVAARLERYIFFPGDYITEKGDVDHSMYFIQKGEIYCLDMDKEYEALERVVDLYVAGECFGVLQGIFYYTPHTQTYRAKTLSDILVLTYNRWEDLRIAFPGITKAIYSKAMQS